MSKLMKALQWDAKSQKVSIVHVPIPTLEEHPGHVLVKVAYAGVCGTDLHILELDFAAAEKVILGHETCGTVIEVGKNVLGIRIGAVVSIDPACNCGMCKFCKRGQKNYCITGGLRSYIGFFSDGGWAEYIRVPAMNAAVHTTNLPLDLCVLAEPMSCIYQGWKNMGSIPEDSKILIIGAGIIGLLYMSLFHHKGFRDVTITQRKKARRDIATNLGLGYTVTTPDTIPVQFESLNPEVDGFDVIMETSGNPEALQDAFPFLCRGGKLIIFGCCPKESTMTINPAEIMLRELTIVGALINPFCFTQACRLLHDMADKYISFDKGGYACLIWKTARKHLLRCAAVKLLKQFSKSVEIVRLKL